MSHMEPTALSPSPTDGITCVRFSAGAEDQLLVSSWDCSVRVYDVGSNRLRLKLEVGNPVLATCYGGDKATAYCGGLEGSVVQLHLETPANSHPSLGGHAKPVSCIRYNPASGLVFSGSWDATVAAWDPKAGTKTPSLRLQQQDKVYSMSMHDHTLVVGTAAKQVAIYDVRSADKPIEVRDAPLKYQIRCVEMIPGGQGYVVTTTEGRVGIEYLNGKKGYAFKCHRQKIDETDTLVFPVNTVAFHPGYGTFATGGCDGVVNMWDGDNKKRICQLAKFGSSVASMAFNFDGSKLAVAASYTYEEGPKDHQEDTVYVRTIQDADVRPKSKDA